ncbi:MAG: sulfatase [Akkermansiaceae bacterium]|nr:sulfatase [Akkermansiaceae bacterium]
MRFLAPLALLMALISPVHAQEKEPAKPLNIVLITADDMNWDSLGCTGSTVPNITPHLDQLAKEGMLFRQAHATVTVCQPVRATMHTGLYTLNNGCTGFGPIREDVRTINEVMDEHGYLISMLAKTPHYEPFEKWCVDYKVHARDLDVGRNPEKFRLHTRKFLKMAAEQDKPFFHHVNCQDPHRPFSWSGEEVIKGREGTYPPVTREIQPEEVEIPGFLEQLPAIRQEVADYYTCVHRLDQCVGVVMDELKAAGHDQDTLVVFFGGDHGMAFPFAKSNAYDASSRAALILRWPDVIPANQVDDEHLVATIDLAPTLLEAAGLPAIEGIDGRSFLAIAKGEKQKGWERVFTMYHETFSKRQLQMRCVRTKDKAYIWNAWSDGKQTYRAENMSGMTWKAMLMAAETHPEIRERCDFYLYRTPEEYYITSDDPNERRNLIDDPKHQEDIAAMKKEVEKLLVKMNDPLLGEFRKLMK